MNTISLYPSQKESLMAIAAVKQSLSRTYRHYIKAFAKQSTNGTLSFSHLSITTDPIKAEDEDYLSPEQWLDANKKRNKK